MNNLIEPNLHPIFVHFVVGLLFTAALALAVVAVAPARAGWRDRLKTAGDWMLALGLVVLVAAVIAGFQAYFTVAHDGPSHSAMLTHRNWALATAAVFAGLGLWRWRGRAGRPSTGFAAAALIAAILLTVTAWWGARLVFHHGLGVADLPQATDGGHHHTGDGHSNNDEAIDHHNTGSGTEDDHEEHDH